MTLDGLEKAYIKDAVTEAEYTETCTRLLKQYKSSLGDDTVAQEFGDLESFKRTWAVGLEIPVAYYPTDGVVSWSALVPLSVSELDSQRQLNRPPILHPLRT